MVRRDHKKRKSVLATWLVKNQRSRIHYRYTTSRDSECVCVCVCGGGHEISNRNNHIVVYWPPTPPNMPFQRRLKCIFHWRGWAWLTIWNRVKIPRYSHKLMNRTRVTCELHDSYFRSMTIKNMPFQRSGVELLYNSVHRKFNELVWGSEELEKWCCRENSTQQRAGPPGLRLSKPGERERNADGHKSGEVNMLQFCSVSTPSHTQTVLLKWEVYFSKNCVARLSLCRCYDFAWICGCIVGHVYTTTW